MTQEVSNEGLYVMIILLMFLLVNSPVTFPFFHI